MTSSPEAPDDAIDRYRLTRLHSEGGLGRVWLATDPDVGREVALKELLAEQAQDPSARDRFVGEARITGQLEHPNIVPVYDVGEREEDRRPFYTMRFVRGPTLAVAIRDNFEQHGERGWPRSRQRLVRTLVSIGNAISHAHTRGIVHRDLKPENIVMGPHGELILLDWGLAKRIGPHAEGGEANEPAPQATAATHPLATSVVGTIAYMAPEQAEGRAPDERTDVYGLGAILFEVLTGRPPHTGDDPVRVLERIIEGETPRARATLASVPAALDAICAKAMARRREDRYATAGAFVRDIERWLADEPVDVLPDSLPTAIARWTRRHQSLALVGAAGLLLVGIVATVAAIWLGASAERERGLAERGAQVSARLAARALGSEMEVRWGALQASARDEALRRALREPTDERGGPLQRWIEREFGEHGQRLAAVSWIVQDRAGIQRARAPFSEASVGRSYAFRDYFHGGGRDLDPTATDVEPIRGPHLSAVFRSQVTQNLMVAFTVPVWDRDEREDRSVLGVLGMTVELGLGLFDCLKQLGLDDDQIAVLIDTREDWNDRRGLVLQHPELVRGRAAGQPLVAQHVSPQQLETFTRTHAGVIRNYRDGFGGAYSGSWLAAFEPVHAGRYGAGDTGWVVVIQEREAPGR